MNDFYLPKNGTNVLKNLLDFFGEENVKRDQSYHCDSCDRLCWINGLFHYDNSILCEACHKVAKRIKDADSDKPKYSWNPYLKRVIIKTKGMDMLARINAYTKYESVSMCHPRLISRN